MVRVGESVFRGIPVSAGVCKGRLLVLGPSKLTIPEYVIDDHEVQGHIERLEQAMVQTRQQLHDVQGRVTAAMGAQDASIFEAHLLMLEDPVVLEEVTRLIREQKVNVESAFSQVANQYIDTLGAVADDYFRERIVDMRDVTSRVLHNLLGNRDAQDLRQLTEPCIIVAEDLTPSATALLDRAKVLGFATDRGSKTSHTAILARSMRLPAAVGLQDATRHLHTGQYALLDGYSGVLILNPTEQTLFEYGQIVRKQADIAERLRDVADKPAVTLDGHRISLSANVEGCADLEEVRASGAEGVGLFRTEYLFINRETLPTEEEQYRAFREVAVALKPAPVIIRTLDLGGDKFLSFLQVPTEVNPFLGWRAIRFCLQQRDIFRRQLRAVLRASAEGNLKLMYPMISGVDEVNQANALVEECKAELRAEQVPFDDALEIGVMVEIPSAAVSADALARRVRFFSIGTNDLIQYSLAVDRLNPKIAHLYEPTHPAVLRLIKMTVDAGKAQGIWTGVCGEMAGDPILVPLLLGLGVDELSVAPPLIPAVKYMVRHLKLTEACALAEFALRSDSGSDILERAQALARASAPLLFEGSRPVSTA